MKKPTLIFMLLTLVIGTASVPGLASTVRTTGYELERIEWRHDEKTGNWYVDTNECNGCISHWYRVTGTTLLRHRNSRISVENASQLKIRMAYILVDPKKRLALEIHLN